MQRFGSDPPLRHMLNKLVGGASRMTRGEIAGVVLTSTLTREGAKPERKETVFAANLAAINVPVFTLSHSGDKCAITPPSDAANIKVALTSSPKVEVVVVSGGLPPVSDPCEAKAGHGLLRHRAQRRGADLGLDQEQPQIAARSKFNPFDIPSPGRAIEDPPAALSLLDCSIHSHPSWLLS